jgi:hypothetical protein
LPPPRQADDIAIRRASTLSHRRHDRASASRIRHANGRAQIIMFGVTLAGKPNDQDWRQNGGSARVLSDLLYHSA